MYDQNPVLVQQSFGKPRSAAVTSDCKTGAGAGIRTHYNKQHSTKHYASVSSGVIVVWSGVGVTSLPAGIKINS